ncbi:MAG: aminotransferase class I/II-fold pyridoxal phosphate-dependent enzyme [Clostridiaceae bacterium]|jgi:arginine decarboxylase|nr:aminotransferase class I/II-fold pyridoxal phosphate-dependent enzyme [Clostridiaceae bacterium]
MKKRELFPIINALEEVTGKNKIMMHMPGHKGGKGFSGSFGDNLLRYDLTELQGLDNLHRPSGVIGMSMDACAKAFGAVKSFFLLNGSTSGIHAMLLSGFKQGDRVLVSRNCHYSVINGLILFEIQPVFVMPRYNEDWQLAVPAEAEDWERALHENPDVKGAIVTSPDYYGLCAPISELSGIMHASGKLLLVDEAHGAHFAFSQRFPPTAISLGADMAVQSFHKTLPALTQAAVLHIGSRRVNIAAVQKAVSMLTTTSPSYMIMASIEYACGLAGTEGEKRYGRLLERLELMKRGLSGMDKLRLVPDELDGFKRDPSRIVVNTANSDISGFDLARILSSEYGIYPEMADEYNVVFITAVSDGDREIDALQRSLAEINGKAGRGNRGMRNEKLLYAGECIMPDRWSYLHGGVKIPLVESEGFRSAGIVTPYPPGIPVLCPGEAISKEHIDCLRRLYHAGAEIHGLTDGARTKDEKTLKDMLVSVLPR